MELQDVAEEFCQTPLYYLSAGSWVLADVQVRLPPYDRFISDRAFGQKKRLIQTPGGKFLPTSDFFRVGSASSNRTYMIESLNNDTDEGGDYLNIYMAREAPYSLTVLRQTKTPRPSGAESVVWTQQEQLWCDIDRYGVLHSSELPGVDYTSFTVVVPKSLGILEDVRLLIDGHRFAVSEWFDSLELRQLRVRRINGDS